MNIKLLIAEANPNILKCTGLVFRAKIDHYLDKRETYVNSVKMILLKRKSCKCDGCYGLLECYHISCSEDIWPILPKDIVNDQLYTLRIINEHTDWESGYVDDYDLEFVRIPV